MVWQIEEAQQQFSAIINASETKPQLIYQHERPFVAVIAGDLLQEFLIWQRSKKTIPLTDAIAELQQICIEEDYTFEKVIRSDRPNQFTENTI